MASDLVVFLRARLDEDERVARDATPGPWRYSPDKCWRKPGSSWFEEAVFAGPSGTYATCVAGTGDIDDPPSIADAQHIARWDPARALAEVEAKRRVTVRYEFARNQAVLPSHSVEERERWDRIAGALEFCVRDIAELLYAGHPDYDPGWEATVGEEPS